MKNMKPQSWVSLSRVPWVFKRVCGHLVLPEAESARKPKTVDILWEFLGRGWGGTGGM